MFNRARKPVSVLMLTTMVLAACQDAVLAPEHVAPRVSVGSTQNALAHAGLMNRNFACFIQQQAADAPNGYRTKSEMLRFPTAAVASDLSVMIYTVRVQPEGQAPVAAASCVIPRTAMAVALTHKKFGVQQGAKIRTRDQNGQTREGTVGVLSDGCVTSGACTLETLEVIAAMTQHCLRGDCWMRGDDTAVDDGGAGGGGEGGYTNEGPLAWIGCIGAGLVFLGGGALTYAALEQYHAAISAYGSAKLRYEYNPSWENYIAMVDAERNVNTMTMALAGSGAVTVGSFLAVVALCSPSVLLPTP